MCVIVVMHGSMTTYQCIQFRKLATNAVQFSRGKCIPNEIV